MPWLSYCTGCLLAADKNYSDEEEGDDYDEDDSEEEAHQRTSKDTTTISPLLPSKGALEKVSNSNQTLHFPFTFRTRSLEFIPARCYVSDVNLYSHICMYVFIIQLIITNH